MRHFRLSGRRRMERIRYTTTDILPNKKNNFKKNVGKGLNVWDELTHDYPEKILDGSNGDVACDSYHNYLEDVRIAKELGLDFYRFSLSWSRILPYGLENKVNPDGIIYYTKLMDALLANGIQPIVTLFHWDLPVYLRDMGGFSNQESVNWFIKYAGVAFDNFGDRVKYWITFNEPIMYCSRFTAIGYDVLDSPVLGSEEYLCGMNLLLSHANVYKFYNAEYKYVYNGSVGIALDSTWYEPYSEDDLDIEATERMIQFQVHHFPLSYSSSEKSLSFLFTAWLVC